MKLLKELIQEIKLVLTGKTLDILLPPLIFVIVNIIFGLITSLIVSLLLSILFTIRRIYHKENYFYAIGGFIGVSFAIMMTFISENASNFFLADLIGTTTLILVTIVSLAIKKPLAIWVSHITRGWQLEWFYLKEVKPAYTEVTIFWLLFFIIRLVVESFLYFNSSVNELALANVILGYPVLILVLTISYIYGITRLRNLKGPGVDEFREGKEPPYKGQTRGF